MEVCGNTNKQLEPIRCDDLHPRTRIFFSMICHTSADTDTETISIHKNKSYRDPVVKKTSYSR